MKKKSLFVFSRSSVRWKNSRSSSGSNHHHDLLSGPGPGPGNLQTDDDDSTDDDVLKELQVPVQFRQMSDNVPSSSNNRKDLSKFLGFDDSDSEEIVFIQNTKSTKQPASFSSFESCLMPPYSSQQVCFINKLLKQKI